MKYFFIFGNICSILGFVAAIYQMSGKSNLSATSKTLMLILVVLSIIFWLFFYLKPQNRIANYIETQTDFSGKYTDSQNQTMDIVEGEFEVNTMNWGTSVDLPPFEEQPIVRILYCIDRDTKNYPKIVEVTEDYFKVQIGSSTQTGKWKWRARGKLLQSMENGGNENDL